MNSTPAAAFVNRGVALWSPQIRELVDGLAGLAFVAGGAARQIVMDTEAPPAEDIDLFVFNERGYDEAARELVAIGYEGLAEFDNAGQFARRAKGLDAIAMLRFLPVQLIRPRQDRYVATFGRPREVLERFSFTTELFAIVGTEAIIGRRAEADTAARVLVVNHVTDPVALIQRATKYARKGYSISTVEITRILEEWGRRRGY